MTVSLPDKGDGSRRQRRSAVRRHGQRSAVRIVAGVALAAVVGAIGWVIVGLIVDDESPGAGSDGTTETTADTTAGPGLLVLTDDSGSVYGVTVFQPRTAAIVHIPPGTLVEVPSLGLASLRDAAGEGGLGLLQQSLENLLGFHFDATASLGPAEVSGLGPPLTVSVADAVEERDATGRVHAVIPAGNVVVDATNAVPFLQAVGDGTALERLVRHQQFWSAYLDASPTPDAPLAAIAALRRASDDVQQRVLPVEAVAGVEGDEELYRVVEADVETLVGRLFPEAPRGGADRIRVRILNGAGAPGVAQRLQPLLIDAGGRMTLSGNADRFDYAVTQVVYYDDARRADAEAIRDAIGVGEVVKSLAELAVVDVTVVVGADFLAADPSRPGG